MKYPFFNFCKTSVCVLTLLFVTSCSIKKNDGNTKKLELNKNVLFLQVSSSETLTSNIENVKWKSADSGIARIQDGKVTAVAVGETVVRAILDEQVASCKVRVGDIKIAQAEYSVAEGQTVRLTADVSLPQDDGEKTITWKSEDESVAIVDTEGTVQGIKIGKTRLVAMSNGMQTTCVVEVTEKVLAFEANISNIHGINADFSITPNKSDVVYAFGIMTKAKYDRQTNLGDAQKPPVGVFAFDRDKYKNMADASSGRWRTWQEAAKANMFYKNGTQTGKVVSDGLLALQDIRPDTECVLYYYLINETDNVPQGKIFTKEFKFAPESSSNNRVTCAIKKRYINGVKADFKTSNADSYFVAICKANLVKWYTEGSGKTQGKTLKDMAYQLVATSPGNHIFSGDHILTPKEIKIENSAEGSVYYLVWFVYDAEHGVGSDVWLQDFATSNQIWTD